MLPRSRRCAAGLLASTIGADIPVDAYVHQARWNKQILRAKMFDCLIYNKDPNLGNWLVDPAWNLILIDHTRSFTSDKKFAHTLQRVDSELWQRMKALTEEQLHQTLGRPQPRRLHPAPRFQDLMKFLDPPPHGIPNPIPGFFGSA